MIVEFLEDKEAQRRWKCCGPDERPCTRPPPEKLTDEMNPRNRFFFIYKYPVEVPVIKPSQPLNF